MRRRDLLEFRILGPLEVRDGERALPLGAGRQRALLAILLLNANDAVSGDRLIDALWDGQPPATAVKALQGHVSQLRKLLGDDVLLTRPRGYELRVDDDQLDANRFARLLDEGRRSLAEGNPAEARSRLDAALALWRGRALDEFAHEEFALGEVEGLEELRLAAVEERVEAELALGRHAEVVAELERLVTRNPLRERPRGQLMLALYRSGRQVDALEAYREGRRKLAEDLGLDPGPALQELERAILRQDPALAPPAHEPSRAVPSGTVTFVFTDIEGSTELVRGLGDDYADLLSEHHRLVRDTFGAADGQEIDTQGDSFFFAFRRARDAVEAAASLERAAAAQTWPGGEAVRIRVGIHTGEPGVGDHGYHGIDVVRAARISAAAHGGQVLLSATTASLLGESTELIDLGEHELKGLARPERLYQLGGDDLAREFPPPRTGEPVEATIVDRGDELAEAAQEALARPRRRRLHIVAPAAAVVVAATAAVALWATRDPPPPQLVSIPPNSVGLIDAKTNRIVGAVPVGARPVAVAVGEGGVWVGNGDDLTVTRIDAETRAVVKTIGIGAAIADMAIGEGSVWVANGNDARLTRIDPRENAVAERIDLSRPGAALPRQALFVAAAGRLVWIGTFGHGVLRIDQRTSSIRRVLSPAAAGGPVAVGKNAVWAGGENRVARRDRRTNLLTTTLVAPYPERLALGAGSVWAVVQGGGIEQATGGREASLWRLDPQDGRVTGTFSAGRDVIDVAVGAGSVWVASSTARDVRRIDADTGDLVATIPLGAVPTSLAYGDGVLWVTVKGRD